MQREPEVLRSLRAIWTITVRLGEPGHNLTIIRALYGDPKLLRKANGPSFQVSIGPSPRLRRIQLPKGVVAFCGGRHQLGAALASDGEVWTWGEALGQETRAIRPLQWLFRGLNRVGVGVDLGDPGPVTHKEPTRVGVESVER